MGSASAFSVARSESPAGALDVLGGDVVWVAVLGADDVVEGAELWRFDGAALLVLRVCPPADKLEWEELDVLSLTGARLLATPHETQCLVLASKFLDGLS
ncbi:hypothetical protein [Rhizobacter sp. Root1221]|uniref:hypothetical protein n=1 Tax=Rhizobacter sp. Root1221 TaxID=1736433 RepID=UPI00071535A2|nr:hypothetical protein [Rhizobacter sp. Root1221]KQW00071.1 hypothetical protein ASC87_18795 [Rhizobacter sp. Root1221]